ncbi:MAG TPA: VWA domain-containing protein [Thermoanaerobaculia bacterium]|nr:VWA domain-containing protein [Thermoanaerobaculia bacterium]
MSRPWKLLACSALILALSLSLSAAQSPSPPASEPFGEVIDVRVVNVEVVVTDKDGNRVQGLKPGDFRLRVDGKEVPVDFFTEVLGGQAIAPDSGQGQPAAGVAPGQAVGTWYLVFVDDFFAQSAHRNQVLEALRNDLSRLGPEDRMAVVAFDGGRLAMLSSWSNSARDLSRVLGDAMARPVRGPLRTTELREMLNNEQFTAENEDPFEDGAPSLNERILNYGLSVQEKAYGSTLARQVQSEVSAVVSAMRATSGVPGRKVLLLLSGGWPYSIQSFIRGDADTSLSRELPDGEQLYRPLTTTANLLGYTIYPVDVPGVQSEAAGASSFGFAGNGGRYREQEIEGALSFLSKETGGRPMLNTQRGMVLEVAETDTRSYYWLGFTPTWERNDKPHQVDVQIQRPGLTARYRNSFLDMSKQASVSMILESALLFGNLPDALPMPVRVGAVQSKKGSTEIPLTLALPVSAFTVVPMGGKHQAKLELRVVAADDQGNRSDIQVIPLELASDKEPKAGGYVKYETKVTIKGKPKHLVLATYDPLSGKIATAQADIPP